MTLLKQLDALIALRAKATPKPWRISPHPDGGPSRAVDMGRESTSTAFIVCHGDNAPQLENAAFIAAVGSFDFAQLRAALAAKSATGANGDADGVAPSVLDESQIALLRDNADFCNKRTRELLDQLLAHYDQLRATS